MNILKWFENNNKIFKKEKNKKVLLILGSLIGAFCQIQEW